jgi:hypothetical protein
MEQMAEVVVVLETVLQENLLHLGMEFHGFEHQSLL